MGLWNAFGALLMALGVGGAAAPPAPTAKPAKKLDTRAYYKVVKDSASMVSDNDAQFLARQHGLNILNVTWEDTGRFKGSAVGPNISDMTIQVQTDNPDTGKPELTLMPVIRHPNFSDKTADLSLDSFHLLVGNQKGQGLQKVSLRDFLGDIRKYLHDGESWAGERTSLLAKRDTHALVSAQAAFLPVPKGGEAQFNPVLFNYQSYEGDPAVLTILATREGTSVTVIDNKRDGFEAGASWGQRLFFNANGQRASFTGTRLSDFQSGSEPVGGPTPSANGEAGMNMVLLVQVPLKQKNPRSFGFPTVADGVMLEGAGMARRGASNVENAVIGHGDEEGPFTEIDGLEIERDERFPVRVTVQFYKATSNGVVSDADMTSIAAQLKRVYDDAEYVGSLVTEGETGRPTEYTGAPKFEPPGWWADFWRTHHMNTGQTPEEAVAMLRKLLKDSGWTPRDPQHLIETLERNGVQVR